MELKASRIYEKLYVKDFSRRWPESSRVTSTGTFDTSWGVVVSPQLPHLI
jgi:hypothetical protein